MTIRRKLLAAFLLAGLVPAMVLTFLAFMKARSALQGEIERNLAMEAGFIAADIDKTLFERLQNAAIWSRLDVMQDMQVDDVDKRLASFLADLQDGYGGVYRSLSCLDGDDRVISSSQPGLIGSRRAKPPSWLTAELAGQRLTLAPPDADGLLLEAPIVSRFSGAPLGRLQLQLDWTRIHELLDRAIGDSDRLLAVVDRDGRLIAGSRGLREQGRLGTSLAGWAPAADTAGAAIRDGAPFHDSAVIVGIGRSRGYAGFAGFGWTTLMLQPIDAALAPVHRMALIFLALLGLTSLAAIAIAGVVSHGIARPIMALTAFTRGYMRDKALVAPPGAATGEVGEVGELTDTFVRMVEDIDRSRQDLVRASKLAVVGEMSSIIAHEVRTPLGILRSSAQMLRREPGISDEGREMTDFIESETERLNRLVSAMLDSARPRPPQLAPTDLHQLIAKGAGMLAAQAGKKQVSIETRLAATNPVAECDREQMTQVLLNLILNGLQILHEGGRLEIATADAGDELCIEIADDGPGIAPEERSRVFEAFFFRREGGVGLGLAIVQQIVAAHGGRIAAGQSALGGALFQIQIPRKANSE